MGITGTKTFQMQYLGKDYTAELRKGKLHWDDDDVWTRQSSVTDGDWHNASFDGIDHTAELRDDGTLHWDDGDVWKRPAKEAPPHRQVQPRRVSERSKCYAAKEPHQAKEAPPQKQLELQHVSQGAKCSAVAKEPMSKQADDTPAAVGVSSQKKRVIVSRPVDAKRYQGVVSWFRGSYGWLQSPEFAARYPNRVIFLHVNDCDSKPRQGDKLSFQVSDDVKPEFRNQQVKAVCARQVHDEACINARDFIQQRRLLRGV